MDLKIASSKTMFLAEGVFTCRVCRINFSLVSLHFLAMAWKIRIKENWQLFPFFWKNLQENLLLYSNPRPFLVGKRALERTMCKKIYSTDLVKLKMYFNWWKIGFFSLHFIFRFFIANTPSMIIETKYQSIKFQIKMMQFLS